MKISVKEEEPSNAFSELAAHLDASGVTRRARDIPIWDSDRPGRLVRLFFGHGSDRRPQILEALLESGNPVFLRSFRSSPADDSELANLEWVSAGPNAWRLPQELPIRTFLESGFAADEFYQLSVHSSQPPDFGFSDEMLVGPIEPYLEHLRSHGVQAVFVSGPHFGWGLALPTLWQREPGSL